MGAPSVVAARPRAAGAGDVEITIARGMARHAVVLLPLLATVGLAWRGVDGAWSAALGLAIVVANVVAAARLARWAASVSAGALLGAALGGYVVRLAAITGFVLLLRNVVDIPALGMAIVVSQLTLLTWEIRSLSLASQPQPFADRRPVPTGVNR